MPHTDQVPLQIDKETYCLREFTDSLSAGDVIPDIKEETALLVEIKDISDELHILQSVLEDQKKTMQDMYQLIAEIRPTTREEGHETTSLHQNRVLETHLYRIQKMQRMAEKSYKGVSLSNFLLIHPYPNLILQSNRWPKAPTFARPQTKTSQFLRGGLGSQASRKHIPTSGAQRRASTTRSRTSTAHS